MIVQMNGGNELKEASLLYLAVEYTLKSYTNNLINSNGRFERQEVANSYNIRNSTEIILSLSEKTNSFPISRLEGLRASTLNIGGVTVAL